MGHGHPLQVELREADGGAPQIGHPSSHRRSARLRVHLDPQNPDRSQPLLPQFGLVSRAGLREIEVSVHDLAAALALDLDASELGVIAHAERLRRAGWAEVDDRRAVVSFDAMVSLFENLAGVDVWFEGRRVLVDPEPLVALPEELEPIYVWRHGVVLDDAGGLHLLDLEAWDRVAQDLAANVRARRVANPDWNGSWFDLAVLDQRRQISRGRRRPPGMLQLTLRDVARCEVAAELLVLDCETGEVVDAVPCPPSVGEALRIVEWLDAEEVRAIELLAQQDPAVRAGDRDVACRALAALVAHGLDVLLQDRRRGDAALAAHRGQAGARGDRARSGRRLNG